MSNVNLMVLFAKYMAHIGYCEGTNCMSKLEDTVDEIGFSDEEISTLRHIEAMSSLYEDK